MLKAQTIVVDFKKRHTGFVAGLVEVTQLLRNGANKIYLKHLETRPAKDSDSPDSHESYFLSIKGEETDLLEFCEKLRSSEHVDSLQTFSATDTESSEWIPRHISELDNCQRLMVQIQPELQTDHPGFHDEEYKKRRRDIAQLAFSYRYGDPLPEVEYTETEKKTWQTAYTNLKSQHASRACAEYIEGFRLLEECGVFRPDEIPQMKVISRVLERTSGFRLRPTAGLVTPRDFLANFAFRVFPCSQYIRHHSQPQYTPEPDLIHEFIGHVPLLTNRKYADFVQQIGLWSIGATEEEVKKFATMFWFTIEFGLCLENSEHKAYGAGVLSSYGELENAFSDTSEKRPFDPNHAAIEPYSEVKYQAVYFVCDSLERPRKQFFEYLKSVGSNRWPHYDPYTQTVCFETAEGARKLMLTDIEVQLETMKLLDLF